MAGTAGNLKFCEFLQIRLLQRKIWGLDLVYLSFWKSFDVVENNELYEGFACQRHNPRDSCRILKFLVVFSNGFWAFDGFSRRVPLISATFGGGNPKIQGAWKWLPEKE